MGRIGVGFALGAFLGALVCMPLLSSVRVQGVNLELSSVTECAATPDTG